MEKRLERSKAEAMEKVRKELCEKKKKLEEKVEMLEKEVKESRRLAVISYEFMTKEVWRVNAVEQRLAAIEGENELRKEEQKSLMDDIMILEAERAARKIELREMEEKMQDVLFKLDKEKRARKSLDEMMINNAEWLEMPIEDMYKTNYENELAEEEYEEDEDKEKIAKDIKNLFYEKCSEEEEKVADMKDKKDEEKEKKE